MSRRKALLGTTALCAAAWLPAASAVFLAGVDAYTGSKLWQHYGGLPTTQWLTYLPYAAGNGAVDLWLKIAAGVASIPPLGCAIGWLRSLGGNKPPLHGESHFATKAEIREQNRRDPKAQIVYSRAPMGDGILLGRAGPWSWSEYIYFIGEGHVGLYSRTRGGKGVSFAVPNCLAWEGSLVALDIKGELYKKTAARRRALGQEAHCFAPSSKTGRTVRYNPYSVVPRDDPAECIDMIHRINHIIIPPTAKAGDGTARYFDESARDAINGAAVILAETPEEPLHVGAVRRGFLRTDWRQHWRDMIRSGRKAGRPYPQTAVDAVLSVVDDPDEKGREGIRRTILSHLGLWASPKVVAATETSDFDLSQMRKKGISIYLKLRPTQMRRFRPLTTLLFQQLIDLNTETEFGAEPDHSHHILMMMDEVWAAGRMDILADASAFVASFGFHLAYVTQTKDQLVNLYGKEGAKNLFENTHVEIVFGVKGVELSKEVSEMTGDDTVQETTQNRPRFWAGLQWGKQTESEASRRRKLLLPQEVRRLSPRKEIIFVPGLMPIMAEREIYYRDERFALLETEPPEVPELKVTVARDDGKSPVSPPRPPAGGFGGGQVMAISVPAAPQPPPRGTGLTLILGGKGGAPTTQRRKGGKSKPKTPPKPPKPPKP